LTMTFGAWMPNNFVFCVTHRQDIASSREAWKELEEDFVNKAV